MNLKKTVSLLSFVGLVGIQSINAAEQSTSTTELKTETSKWSLGIESALSNTNGGNNNLKFKGLDLSNALEVSYKASENDKFSAEAAFGISGRSTDVADASFGGVQFKYVRSNIFEEKEDGFGFLAEVRTILSNPSSYKESKKIGTFNVRATFTKSFLDEKLNTAVQFSQAVNANTNSDVVKRKEHALFEVAYAVSDKLTVISDFAYVHKIRNKDTAENQRHSAIFVFNPIVGYQITDKLGVSASAEMVPFSEDDDVSGFGNNWVGKTTYSVGIEYTLF